MKITVRGIKRVTSRAGRTYYYHRQTGRRIRSEPGTAAFLAEIEVLNGIASPEPTFPKGSFGALIAAYRASPEFRDLAPRTRADYQRVFNYLQPMDRFLLTLFDGPGFVLSLRDKAYRAHKRRFANYLIQVLSLLFAWGRVRGWHPTNPIKGMPKLRRRRDAPRVNRAWSEAERSVALEALPAELALAVAIGAYTGLRQGDVLRLPWSAYDGQSLTLRQAKTGEALWIPAHSALVAYLDAAPRKSPIIVVGARGRPFTSDGFRARFFRAMRKLEAAGRVGVGLTFHGLRHTVGKQLADAGCDERTIAAILGHRTTAMAAHYSRDADNQRRAAVGIRRLERADQRTAREQKVEKTKKRDGKTEQGG